MKKQAAPMMAASTEDAVIMEWTRERLPSP
jgi:hypothetical protein